MGLTARQSEILDWLHDYIHAMGFAPSARELCAHFRFSSPKAATDHLQALEKKGCIQRQPGKARSISILVPPRGIPLLGEIPAGLPGEATEFLQDNLDCQPKDFGIHDARKAFALKVRGDSMIGRHLVDGDIVILEHRAMPRHGDIVAALLDGEATLKTLVLSGDKAWLKAENPNYPKLFPIGSLEIQGVARGVIRKTLP
jgi:repressor LexA